MRIGKERYPVSHKLLFFMRVFIFRIKHIQYSPERPRYGLDRLKARFWIFERAAYREIHHLFLNASQDAAKNWNSGEAASAEPRLKFERKSPIKANCAISVNWYGVTFQIHFLNVCLLLKKIVFHKRLKNIVYICDSCSRVYKSENGINKHLLICVEDIKECLLDEVDELNLLDN